ncbi:type II secretion system protein [Reinekea sp.]|uniref:type II secretion system protein n=1 Tax=Reinekea sp. TaxID=1970455 RepID=UPI002A82D5BB|nr:type II secretion system protein [Reinekea sp.]
MNKQAGFTLIELIMVIVILGILSAFALPRFADLSGNAESAAMEGGLASAKSTAAIMHASALANGANDAADDVKMEGVFFATVNGYPDAGGATGADGLSDTTGFGLSEAANLGDYELLYETATGVYNTTTTAGQIAASESVLITTSPAALTKPCFIYTQAGTSAAPTYTAILKLGGTSPAFTCAP